MKKQLSALRPIMFVGTASDVGKSVITAGFCRIFLQDGYFPAPFKAQNMSLNSFVTPEGLEIGRAQAVQAEAAKIPCHTDMNPVLLKPTSDKSSQIVLNGKPIGNQTAYEYFAGNDRNALFEEAKQAFQRLSQRYSPIVMEGAGSISELNLKQRDITNMRMAIHANAATFLICDIDRGGIFASLYGTIALLSPEEKKYIKGIIINKFRGDGRLFEDGRKMVEDICKVPVVGVLPYFRDISIEEEDSVALLKKPKVAQQNKVNIAVIWLNRMSNFTDFDRLEKDPRVNLYFSHKQEEIAQADIVILPGSKNTIEDLMAIKNSGLAEVIIDAYKSNKTIVGICGGYQMLGELIEDPHGVESGITSIAGLGLLPVRTQLLQEKTTRQRQFKHHSHAAVCTGYEIHMGVTTKPEGSQPVNYFPDGQTDGFYLNKKCWGTYLHGIFDNLVVVNELINDFTRSEAIDFDYSTFKDQQYEKLAKLIRENINMDQIYYAMKNFD